MARAMNAKEEKCGHELEKRTWGISRGGLLYAMLNTEKITVFILQPGAVDRVSLAT